MFFGQETYAYRKTTLVNSCRKSLRPPPRLNTEGRANSPSVFKNMASLSERKHVKCTPTEPTTPGLNYDRCPRSKTAKYPPAQSKRSTCRVTTDNLARVHCGIILTLMVLPRYVRTRMASSASSRLPQINEYTVLAYPLPKISSILEEPRRKVVLAVTFRAGLQ